MKYAALISLGLVKPLLEMFSLVWLSANFTLLNNTVYIKQAVLPPPKSCLFQLLGGILCSRRWLLVKQSFADLSQLVTCFTRLPWLLGHVTPPFVTFTSEHEEYTIPDKITNSRCKSLFLTIVITTSACHTTLGKFKHRPCFTDPVSVVFPQTVRVLYNSLWPLLVYSEL